MLHKQLLTSASTANQQKHHFSAQTWQLRVGSASDSATNSSRGFSQVTRFLITAFLSSTVQRGISVGLPPFIKFQDLFSEGAQKVYHAVLMPEAQYRP